MHVQQQKSIDGVIAKKRRKTKQDMQADCNKAHELLTHFADNGVRPVLPRSRPPRQFKDCDGNWRKQVTRDNISVAENMLTKYSVDISKIDDSSQRLHCRCGHIFSMKLRNLEVVFASRHTFKANRVNKDVRECSDTHYFICGEDRKRVLQRLRKSQIQTHCVAVSGKTV